MEVLVFWLATSMLQPLLAPFLVAQGHTPTQVGLVLGAQAAPSVLLAVPAGGVAETLGYRWLVTAGAASMSLGGLILGLFEPLGAYVLAQLAIGIGTLLAWLSLQALMIGPGTESHPVRDRVTRISGYSLFAVLGQLCGPAVGGMVADAVGYASAFGVFSLLAGCACLASLGFRSCPPPPSTGNDEPSRSFGRLETAVRSATSAYAEFPRLLRNRKLAAGVAVSFCALYLFDLQATWQPLYFHSLGLDATTTGLILGLGSAAGMVARFVLPVLLLRLGTATVGMLTLLPATVAIAGVTLVRSLAWLIALAAVTGGVLGLAQPLTLELIGRFAPSGRRGASIGLRMLANRASQWIDALLFGLLLGLIGIRLSFVVSALLIAALAIAACRGLAAGSRWYPVS